MFKIICKECNVEFDTENKSKKYCKECLRKRRIYQTMVSRKKRIPTTEIGVGSGNHSSNKKGINNHNTTTGIMLYRDMIDKQYCEQCGSTENLLVHHIDKNRKHNEPDNLQVLCKSCHQKLHCKRDPITGRYIGELKSCELLSEV